jgi:hypothetical protein
LENALARKRGGKEEENDPARKKKCGENKTTARRRDQTEEGRGASHSLGRSIQRERQTRIELSRKQKNKRGLSYLLASFDFESGHDQMLPQPPLCTSTVFFCFPSSSSSSSSSAFSSFFLPAPQRPNTYFRGQTRRKEEIDMSAREAQQTKERT